MEPSIEFSLLYPNQAALGKWQSEYTMYMTITYTFFAYMSLLSHMLSYKIDTNTQRNVEEGEYAMFCSHCGVHAQDGDHFCNNCGASLQATGGVSHQAPMPDAGPSPFQSAEPKSSRRASTTKPQDPYKDQIAQLKLQLKELKLDLKQITTQMANVRSNYFETSAFVPRGLLKWGYKGMEDFKLMGPQQQKQQLQQHIMQLERQLLSLQQAQAQWKLQQQNNQGQA